LKSTHRISSRWHFLYVARCAVKIFCNGLRENGECEKKHILPSKTKESVLCGECVFCVVNVWCVWWIAGICGEYVVNIWYVWWMCVLCGECVFCVVNVSFVWSVVRVVMFGAFNFCLIPYSSDKKLLGLFKGGRPILGWAYFKISPLIFQGWIKLLQTPEIREFSPDITQKSTQALVVLAQHISHTFAVQSWPQLCWVNMFQGGPFFGWAYSRMGLF